MAVRVCAGLFVSGNDDESVFLAGPRRILDDRAVIQAD